MPIEIVPTRSLADGIAATRLMLGVMAFDAVQCELGLYALESYSRKWDEKLKAFHQKPMHDWASHGADALRTGAMAWNDTGVVPHPLSATDDEAGFYKEARSRASSVFTRIFNNRHKVHRASRLNERIENDRRYK